VAAFSVSKGLYGKSRVLFANIFGLADILIVASSIALVLLPDMGPHHTMMYAAFLPAPLWLWFHVISLWKLYSSSANASVMGSEADRFPSDYDPALSQQIFDIPVAQVDAIVEPDSIGDNIRRESVAFIGVHGPILAIWWG
jgi:hypothetical protein